MMQVSSEAPLFLVAGTDGALVLQAALGGAALGVILVVLVFAWRLWPRRRRAAAA